MKEHGRKLVIYLVVAVAGWFMLRASGNFVKKADLDRHKQLCEVADSTTGFLDENAEVYTLQRRSMKASMYKYTYNYYVGGRPYSVDKSSLSDKPDAELTVWYNRTDPGDCSVSSPCEWMAKNGNRIAVSGWVENGLFIIGIVMLLYGLWKVLVSVFRLIVAAIKGDRGEQQPG